MLIEWGIRDDMKPDSQDLRQNGNPRILSQVYLSIYLLGEHSRRGRKVTQVTVGTKSMYFAFTHCRDTGKIIKMYPVL